MKYRVFNTEAEAQAAADAIWQAMQPVIEVRDGQPVSEPVTQRWAIPQQITDGRWVFPSPDDTGEEPGADWWPAPDLEA